MDRIASSIAASNTSGHSTRFSARGIPGGARGAGATFHAGVAPNRPATKRSAHDAPTGHAARSPGERDASGSAHFTAGHAATADKHGAAVPGVEREPADRLPLRPGGPGVPEPPSSLRNRPKRLRSVGGIHDGRQLDHDQQHLRTVPGSRDAHRGMPCRSVWRDRPAADLRVHGHRFVERVEPDQYHLHGLPNAFPTNGNPVDHHGGRLPGGPEWIAHVAGRAAADEDWDIQLPGHHVVAAQPDVHHLDKLGGDWGSSQRGQYMHPQRTTSDVS